MNSLIATTKSGTEISVSIEIKPNDKIQAKAILNNKEYKCELSYAKNIPTIRFSEYSSFIKENYPHVKTEVHIVLNQDWTPIVKELKLKQIEIWKDEAVKLLIPEILKLKFHSMDTWLILNEEIPSYLIKFHPVLSNLKELNHMNFTPTSSDYDDYNSWNFYSIPYKEVKSGIKKTLELKENEAIELSHREEAAKRAEAERNEILYRNVESVDKTIVTSSQGSDGDDFEQYVTVKMKSGTSYKFCARNIFDFGYVLNPTFIKDGGILTDTEAGYVWKRYNDTSIPVSHEELESAKVAINETVNLKGIRL